GKKRSAGRQHRLPRQTSRPPPKGISLATGRFLRRPHQHHAGAPWPNLSPPHTSVAGVYTNQRLNLSKPWKGLRMTCQGFKPDPGNLAVRHYRGASRNIRDGETVNPPAIERAGSETPHLQQGALDLYPNRRHHSKPATRLDPTRLHRVKAPLWTSTTHFRSTPISGPFQSHASRRRRGHSLTTSGFTVFAACRSSE